MRELIIDKFLKFDNVYLDYPFDDTNSWRALRHCENNKIFALVYERHDKLCINFKNKPEWATFWRESFENVTPAYHMNKEHWSTVICGGDADLEQILHMVTDSYNLTLPKRSKK